MSKKNILTSIFLSVALLVINLTLYTPHLIYFSQPEYFEFTFLDLVLGKFLIGLIAAVSATFLLSLLNVKWLKVWALVFFWLAILLWIYSDYFAVSYGVLDGAELPFSDFDSRIYVEICLCLVALLLTVFLHASILKNSVLILSIVNLVLLSGVVFKWMTVPLDIERTTEFDNEFNLYSGEKNVIVIVLDNFGELHFQQALNETPEFKEAFKGFVSYTDAISNYSATVTSLASLLTGEMVPDNEKLIPYLGKVVSQKGFHKDFEATGYEVSVISPNTKFKRIYPSRFMSHPTFTEEQLRDHQGKKLFDYSLFRIVPHHFKPSVFNQGRWLLSDGQLVELAIPNTFPEKGKYILDYVIENVTVDGGKPRFKFIHATIPHPEYVYDKSCQKVSYEKKGNQHPKMLEQSKCALKLLNDLFDQYKANGVYDQSLIVVTSDHGHRILGDATPTSFPSNFEMSASGIMFMIKGVGQNQPFRQVNQPFSLLKLRSSLLTEKHDSAFDQMQDDQRLFYAYRPVHKTTKGYLQSGPLYEVGKNHKSVDSWQLKKVVNNACPLQSMPVQMLFGMKERKGYCGAIWFRRLNQQNAIVTKNRDNRISFGLNEASVKEQEKRKIKFVLAPQLRGEQNEVNFKVLINGFEVGETRVDGKGLRTIEYGFDAAYLQAGENEIQLLLPGIKSGQELGVNNGKDRLGVLIKEIVIE